MSMISLITGHKKKDLNDNNILWDSIEWIGMSKSKSDSEVSEQQKLDVKWSIFGSWFNAERYQMLRNVIKETHQILLR